MSKTDRVLAGFCIGVVALGLGFRIGVGVSIEYAQRGPAIDRARRQALIDAAQGKAHAELVKQGDGTTRWSVVEGAGSKGD